MRHSASTVEAVIEQVESLSKRSDEESEGIERVRREEKEGMKLGKERFEKLAVSKRPSSMGHSGRRRVACLPFRPQPTS